MTFLHKAGWRFGPGLLGVLLLSAGVAVFERGWLTGAYLMAQSKPVSAPKKPPVYVPPPDIGAPLGRIGGGTRSLRPQDPGAALHVSVLAPDHVGLTTQAQPSLYWYVSGPAPDPMTLTVRAEHATAPLLQVQIRAPLRPGIYRATLADYGVHLEPTALYRWFVAVPSRNDRSSELISSGVIKHVERPEALRTRLARAHKTRLPYIYAEAGYWYDAVEAVSQLIETTPDAASMRRLRAALSEQVGLQEAAAYDGTAGAQ